MVTYENEARIHLAMAIGALGLALIVLSHGLTVAALPAMFTVGWSGAIAWMIKVRNMRPNLFSGSVLPPNSPGSDASD